MDAVVAHSEHGARRLREEVGLDPARVRVIPHGAFDYLTALPDERPLPAELEGAGGAGDPLLRAAAPLQGDRHPARAFRALDGAELWVVGNPRMDLAPLHALAAEAPGRVRFLTRFVEDAEIPAIFRRADVVVLPYRDAEHSGVLYTALAFGKPIVLSAVGGFPEIAEQGAARLVPPEDPAALAAALAELIGDEAARAELASAAASRRGRPLFLGRGRRPDPRPLPGAAGVEPVIALEIVFWLCAALIVYTHARLPPGPLGPHPPSPDAGASAPRARRERRRWRNLWRSPPAPPAISPR